MMTNGSGGTATAGAVVVTSNGTADTTFTTTTTASYADGRVGILLADTDPSSDGPVVFEGVGGFSPTIASGTPAAGDYLFTSYHAGERHRRRYAGGWRLRSRPGGPRLGTDIGAVELWGVPDGTVSATGSSGADGSVVVDISTVGANGRGVRYGEYTYVPYVNGTSGDVGGIVISHKTGRAVSSFVLHSALGADDHNLPSFEVNASGNLEAAYSAHSGAAMYLRISTSSLTTDPLLAGGFGSETNLDSTLGGTAYTYPHLVYLSAEAKMYLFCRPVAEGAGQNWSYATRADGGSWSSLTSYFVQASRRSYVNPTRNGTDRIDFVEQNGNAVGGESSVQIGHFYYTGGAWKKSDGTSAGSLPLSHASATQIWDAATYSAHYGSLRIDPDTGYPVLSIKVFHSSSDIRYQVTRWTGSAWQTPLEIADDGYVGVAYRDGGMELTPDPYIAYVSRLISGTMEMWVYRSWDGWLTDDGGTALTALSASDNIHPFSPDRASPTVPVVWQFGTYTDYNDFDLSVRGLVWHQAEPETHTHGASVSAIDDLTDATITSPAEGDMLRYTSGVWVNTPGRWEPVTTNPGTGPELVWDGDEIVMTWSAT